MLLSLLSACGRSVSPNTYDAAEAGVASKVVQGTIIGKRKVKIDGSSGMGGLAGVAAGAAGGSAIGGSDRANIAGAVGGAVLGGLVGHAVDKGVNSHKAYEYIIKLKSGSTISIAQAQELEFNIRQPVLVIYGATTRIVPDDGMDISEPPASKSPRPKTSKRHADKNIDKTADTRNRQSSGKALDKLKDRNLDTNRHA